MKRRISRVSILQTSKVIGIVYGLLALPITLVGFVRLMAPSQGDRGSLGDLFGGPADLRSHLFHPFAIGLSCLQSCSEVHRGRRVQRR